MDSNLATTHGKEVITRHTDIQIDSVIPGTGVLPPVPWANISQSAPVQLSIAPRHPDDPLPFVDVVILTWTSAEWRALDHVFLNSGLESDPHDYAWKEKWLPYTRGASSYWADPKSGRLWGLFQLVQILDHSGRPWRVLLFKSNSHLAHSPWDEGLTAMLRFILEDTRTDRIYTIGTAGGARQDQRLGDSVITNAALLELQHPQNIIDPENGNMYRCPSWFPNTALIDQVERSLLYRMNQVVTDESLQTLFDQLKAKHADDPEVANLQLSDLLNDPIRPDCLRQAKVQLLKDVPLLTTDFYYISKGNGAEAYSFLEMDDAIIAREANRAGIRFACIRNISDPVIRDRTDAGMPIPASIRADWSGLIYTNFGLQTSYNSALVTWATIAGQGRAVYNPTRDSGVVDIDDPVEVKLAFQVRSCGTCSFFWPKEKLLQPYGPYTAFDFDVNVPYPATSTKGTESSPWVLGRTRPPSFPNGEVVDGCRKAPIMTIGINPNLTAFAPGQTGAAWAYPNFSSDSDTDAWAKYAWYYRYRSVYQERFTLDFVKRFILPEGQVLASRSGHVVSAARPDDGPAWTVTVRYDGDAADTTLALPGKLGDFPYVLLFDSQAPNNRFAAGDVIAGRIAVPEGIQAEVMQQPQGYYMQFVPVLEQFENTLHNDGHPSAALRIGEDVSQLDMVACASPHWNLHFLGGSDDNIATIVDNCVSKNAWAIKQMVQTRPAILYIVSVSSWHMFYTAFGAHVQRDIPISAHPADNDFSLLRETTDPGYPAYIDFDVTVDGQRYQHRTRLVITPHFSYDDNFSPQFRIGPADWKLLQQHEHECVAELTAANGFTVVPPSTDYPNGYTAVRITDPNNPRQPGDVENAFERLKKFPVAWTILGPGYYNPHAMMASVLDEMYRKGELSWKEKQDGSGYLARTEGSCRFCVNRHWKFPNECRYDKHTEQAPLSGFLEKVADQIVATGRPGPTEAIFPPLQKKKEQRTK